MRVSLLACLAALALAHPSTFSHGIVGRSIDLNAFRLKTFSKYVNASIAETLSPRRNKRGDYVGAAEDLLKYIADGASYRIVEDHYVGKNKVAHVNFKQNANGLDIDNADCNVNVSVLNIRS
jgi:extracellular elastinolytic metalloproteinase